MADRSLKLYHLLPYPLKVLIATGRGISLNRWRYGPETERLVAEAREREQWSSGQWEKWQQERLAFILHRAATKVPYYRTLWNKRRSQGDRTSFEYLENWPILEKENLRSNCRAFLSDDCDPHKMYYLHTSGTTGKSLDLWWSRETSRRWYALFEARWRRWHGVNLNTRWAILGGQLVAPAQRTSPPFWVWNSAMKQLYMSSYHLSPKYLPSYFDAIKKYRIEYVWGYTSALYSLALEALRAGRDDLQMKVVLTNAEPLADYQRQAISRAFQCPVRETYGMAEIVAGAGECPEGQMHFWPEVGIAEVFSGNDPLSAGAVGDLVCTGLFNPDMPLIRYRVGDRGALPDAGKNCNCGRTLPVMPLIEGRSDAVLMTKDGRQIGRLDPVFKGGLPVIEAQIIQESLENIRVLIVPAATYSYATGQDIVRRLQDRMGPVDVKIEKVSEIPRSANGKFRAVISLLQRNGS